MKSILGFSGIILLIFIIHSCEDKSTIPVISTADASEISNTTAISGGEVTNEGGAPIISRGVCWNTSGDPTIENSKTSESGSLGSFTSTLTELTPNTLYYVRAYATNSIGTGYGSVISFTTASSTIIFNHNLTYGTVTDIDGNVYKTIKIGTQTWMAENLKTTKYKDGTAIPFVSDNNAWAALTTPGYCWYNNDAGAYKATYGALYNWFVVDAASNGGKNACPANWHVPTDNDWYTITSTLGGDGGKLKETGSTHWTSPNEGATNESGFTALPGGYRNYLGECRFMEASGSWWSSYEYSPLASVYRDIYYGNKIVGNFYGNKKNGFSVRCVKD